MINFTPKVVASMFKIMIICADSPISFSAIIEATQLLLQTSRKMEELIEDGAPAE